MATIVTRAGKGSPLTNTEVDANFTNLNTELGTKLTGTSLATVATTGAYNDLIGKPANVSLTGAGTATVTGTYPNFTITSTGGSGTVSSVAASGGTTGLTFTGSPITTSGTLTLGGTLATANGGTNLTSYTKGDLLYASAANVLSKLPIGTQNYSLVSNANIPVWSLVSLQSGVSGTLGVDKGGTGNISYTVGALLAFGGTSSSQIVPDGVTGYALKSNGAGLYPSYSLLSINDATNGTLTAARGGTGLTTYNTGDLLYASASNTVSKLPIGTSTYVLTSNGSAPYWAVAPSGGGGSAGVASFSAGTTGLTPTSAITGAVTLGGTLKVANGGTGKTGFNNGDILYAGIGTFEQLGISGTYGQYLKSNGSVPYWSNLSVNSSDISWNSSLQPYQGGTGTTSSPMNGQLLIGNGSGYSVANLTAGANVTITNSSGGITIAASGGGGAASGPTINSLYVNVSGYSSLSGYAPTSNLSKPLIGATEMSPSNYGAFSFRSTSGNYNINGASISSISISDSANGYNTYNSGSDFSGYPFNFRVDDSIVSCYGLSIYNSAMFALFTASKNAMISPNLGPFDASSAYNNNPDITINTSMGSIYKAGGGGFDVEKGMTGYYTLRFGTGSSFMSGFSIDSINVKAGGAGQYYNMYYSGSDFSSSYSQNTSMGMFEMQIQVFNPTLITLLNNSFRA